MHVCFQQLTDIYREVQRIRSIWIIRSFWTSQLLPMVSAVLRERIVGSH